MSAQRAPGANAPARKRKRAKRQPEPYESSLDFALACEGVCRTTFEMKIDNERRKGPAKDLTEAKQRVTDTLLKLGITDITDIPVPDHLCPQPCTI
jgi:hypothetical protein